MGRLRSRSSLLVVVALTAVLLGGCQWSMYGATPGRTGLNSAESTISFTNVGQVQLAWKAKAVGPAVVGGGFVFIVATPVGAPAGTAPTLQAFAANGVAGCSTAVPAVCSPLWTAATPGLQVGSTAVYANGFVYVSGGGTAAEPAGPHVFVYDAAGSSNCGGTPKSCLPLWTASGTSTRPLVDGGRLFVRAAPDAGDVLAFDATGTINCGGSPKVCIPLWRGTPQCVAIGDDSFGCIPSGPLAAANGRVYLTATTDVSVSSEPATVGEVISFDEAGVAGCGGSPKVCVATAFASATAGDDPPAVAAQSNVLALTGKVDESLESVLALWGSVIGVDGTPVWSQRLPGTTVGKPAITSTVGYFPTDEGVFAIPLANELSCSRFSCQPLWHATTGASALTVANGVVYDDRGRAFSADGSFQCAGLPKVCTPLAQIGPSTPNVGGSETEIVNGWIYRSLPTGFTAYRVPQSPTTSGGECRSTSGLRC